MSVSVTNIMYEWRMLMQWAPVGKNQPVSKEPNKQTTGVLAKNTQLGGPTLGPQATTPFLADLLMPETFQCLTTKPLKNHSNNRKRPNNWLRDATQKKKRDFLGTFPKWRAPPPPPPLLGTPVSKKKVWFILHFRPLGSFLVFIKMLAILSFHSPNVRLMSDLTIWM